MFWASLITKSARWHLHPYGIYMCMEIKNKYDLESHNSIPLHSLGVCDFRKKSLPKFTHAKKNYKQLKNDTQTPLIKYVFYKNTVYNNYDKHLRTC